MAAHPKTGLRFLFDVLGDVRAALGDDFIIGLRLNGAELREGGLTVEDGIEVAKAIDTSGLADFLNVVSGAPYDELGLAEWVPPMGMPVASHLGIAGRIRAEVDLPIFHAGGIARSGKRATRDQGRPCRHDRHDPRPYRRPAPDGETAARG